MIAEVQSRGMGRYQLDRLIAQIKLGTKPAMSPSLPLPRRRTGFHNRLSRAEAGSNNFTVTTRLGQVKQRSSLSTLVASIGRVLP
jgi:hypothetical protein